jgi:hypothetical protein
MMEPLCIFPDSDTSIFYNAYNLLIFFFFLTCPHKGRGRGIRTCDLCFIRRGSQPIELPLGDAYNLLIIIQVMAPFVNTF